MKSPSKVKKEMERSKPSIESKWKEEGGPSTVMKESLMEIWFGNQYSCVVPDPVWSALTCTGAMSWSELGIRKRNLELTPDLPKPCISLSSYFYSSPSSLCPAWPAPLTSTLLLCSPLNLYPCLLHQTSVGFQQQRRAAGHFIKRWPHSAPSLSSRGPGPKRSGKTAGLEL